MRYNVITIIITVIIALSVVLPMQAFASSNIDSIAVRIVSGKSIPEKINKRMEASVSTVSEHIMLGHNINEVIAKKNGYEKLVKEVFDRVLVGYNVDSVLVTPGENTEVFVKVNPWGEVVEKVKVEYEFGSIAPEAAALVSSDLGKIEVKSTDVLLGLPVEAIEWAGSVLKNLLRETAAANLPDYRASIEIVPGITTVIKVILQPQGTVIREVSTNLKSHTLPKLLLTDLISAADKQAKTMYGLPAGFVERHRSYFTDLIRNKLQEHRQTKQYSLKLDLELNLAVPAELLIHTDTNKYKLKLEGYLDMGKTKDNTAAKLHLGRLVQARDEVFAEVGFVPSTMSWNFEAGWGHKLYKNTTAGFKYNIKDSLETIWLKQRIGHNWSPQAGTDTKHRL